MSKSMSGGASVEHDFLGIDNGGSAKQKPTMERKKSFREISRMSPDVIKSVIATSTACAAAVRKTPLPVLSSTSRSKVQTATGVASLTIFYNGTVAVFDLPQEKAENILKLVEANKAGAIVDPSKNLDDDELLENLNGGWC